MNTTRRLASIICLSIASVCSASADGSSSVNGTGAWDGVTEIESQTLLRGGENTVLKLHIRYNLTKRRDLKEFRELIKKGPLTFENIGLKIRDYDRPQDSQQVEPLLRFKEEVGPAWNIQAQVDRVLKKQVEPLERCSIDIIYRAVIADVSPDELDTYLDDLASEKPVDETIKEKLSKAVKDPTARTLLKL
jgi:hypothetical protein